MVDQPDPHPTRMLVQASEFALGLSRRTIRAGAVVIQLRNDGEDDHDLAIQTPAGVRLARSTIARPGVTVALRARVAPGRQVLVCDPADYARRGMRSALTVVSGAA